MIEPQVAYMIHLLNSCIKFIVSLKMSTNNSLIGNWNFNSNLQRIDLLVEEKKSNIVNIRTRDDIHVDTLFPPSVFVSVNWCSIYCMRKSTEKAP